MNKLSAVVFLGTILGIGWVSSAQEPSVPEENAGARVGPPKSEESSASASKPATADASTQVPCPCPTNPTSPVDILKVKEVWIQNQKSDSNISKSSFGVEDRSESNEMKSLRNELTKTKEKLLKCVNARKCREELATAKATIRLENMNPLDGSQPVTWKLSVFDLVGSESIEIINANHGMVINWDSINPNCIKNSGESDETVSNQPPVDDSQFHQPQTDQASAEQNSSEPIDNPLPRQGSTRLQEILQSGAVVAMAESQLYSRNPSIEANMTGHNTKMQARNPELESGSNPFLTGDVNWLTYQQRSLPWTISYEIEGDTLLEWVEFGNLSEYPWECGTRIHFLESEPSANSISFELIQEVGVGKSVRQLLSVRKISSRTWEYDLTGKTQNKSQILTLESVDNMVEGSRPVWGKFHGTWHSGQLVLGRKETRTAKLESFPTPEIEILESNKAASRKLIGLKLGKFQFSEEKSREFLIGDFDPSTVEQKIILKISAEKDFRVPMDSPWTFAPEDRCYFLEATLTAPQISIPPFEEIRSQTNPGELDFYQEADRETLSEILTFALKHSETSKFLEVLEEVVLLDNDIQANLSRLKNLTKSIEGLEKQYENTDRPNRLLLIHREIEKLKEQERFLNVSIFTENAQKELEIARLLETVQ